MNAFINGISYYLPEKILDNGQLSMEYPEWTVDKISSKTGIYERHIADKDEYVSDMAIKALNQFFIEYPISKDSIDYIILCTQNGDYTLPSTACIVQDKAGLSTNCGAVDINLGCSGYIYGLGLAKGLVSSNQARNVMLLTSECYSKIIHPKDKSNRTIFGDAATATLIGSMQNTQYYSGRILDFSYGTDGKGYDKLIVKNSGKKNNGKIHQDVYSDDGSFVSNDDYLFMDGKEIFNFTAFQIPPLIEKILVNNRMSMDEVNTFIFHQANAYMLDFIRKRCRIPEGKFFVSMGDVGNTVSSTIPIALKRYLKEAAPTKRERILLAGFGVGLSTGGVVIEMAN